jgi:hypothetical protein
MAREDCGKDAPLALAAEVNVNVPEGLMAGPAEKSAKLVLLVTMNVRICPASSGGPAKMLVAQPTTICAPESSLTVRLAPFVKLGVSFTGVTVILNVWGALWSTPPLAVPPLSLRNTVTLHTSAKLAPCPRQESPTRRVSGV